MCTTCNGCFRYVAGFQAGGEAGYPSVALREELAVRRGGRAGISRPDVWRLQWAGGSCLPCM